MSEANKAVVRRFVAEIVNRWNPGLLPELVAAGHVDHWPDGDLYGPEGARIGIAEYRAAFADLSLTIEDLIGEGPTASPCAARTPGRSWPSPRPGGG